MLVFLAAVLLVILVLLLYRVSEEKILRRKHSPRRNSTGQIIKQLPMPLAQWTIKYT